MNAQILQVTNEHPITSDDKFEVVLEDDCGGAGSQSVMRSVKSIGSAQNMFVYGIIPLSIKRNRQIIWRNQIPNSPECLRPVYLIREKENDQVLLDYVVSSTDNARDRINENGLVLRFDAISIDVSVAIKDTMKDLKLKKCLSRLGGAGCKQNDWMDIKQIEEGFPINRSADETLKLYQSLVDEDGKIPTKPNDFMVRQG